MYNRLLQYANIGYAQNGKDPAISCPSNQQLHIYSATAKNHSGGAIDVGILKRLPDSAFKVYKYVAIGSVVTDVSTVITGTSKDFFEANGDGFIVSATSKFGFVGITNTFAAAGGTFTLKYWNGSAWAALTSFVVPTVYSNTSYYYVFNPPIDWATGNDTVYSSSSYYSIQVIASTAPANKITLNDLWGAELLEFQGSVADKGTVSLPSFFHLQPAILKAGEGIMPYFGGNATNLNSLKAIYTVGG